MLLVGPLENRVLSSSTTIYVRIVFPALGTPEQNNVCLSAFRQVWLFRVYEPLACSCLSSADEILMLRSVVSRGKPVENSLVLFVTLSNILTRMQPFCLVFGRQSNFANIC
jgi:hypothetical protein